MTTLLVTINLPEDAARLLLRDALTEFVGRRALVHRYVQERYPHFSDRDRAAKVEQVTARINAADAAVIESAE